MFKLVASTAVFVAVAGLLTACGDNQREPDPEVRKELREIRRDYADILERLKRRPDPFPSTASGAGDDDVNGAGDDDANGTGDGDPNPPPAKVRFFNRSARKKAIVAKSQGVIYKFKDADSTATYGDDEQTLKMVDLMAKRYNVSQCNNFGTTNNPTTAWRMTNAIDDAYRTTEVTIKAQLQGIASPIEVTATVPADDATNDFQGTIVCFMTEKQIAGQGTPDTADDRYEYTVDMWVPYEDAADNKHFVHASGSVEDAP